MARRPGTLFVGVLLALAACRRLEAPTATATGVSKCTAALKEAVLPSSPGCRGDCRTFDDRARDGRETVAACRNAR